MVETTIADPAGPLSYNTLKKKYSGWNASNFEDAIKKVTRPSELDELRIAIKYFLSKEEAIKLSELVSARLNELSDRLISFGDFLMAYKNAELAFKEMRDRCVKRGNNWVCASYMAQMDFFINSQATDRSKGGRRPLNDMLGKVREGYELVKILEQKWTEFQDNEQIPGFIEEEIHDIFKGLLAREIGLDRFWAAMDIRSEVEDRPIITPAKKQELIELWIKHGIIMPTQKITKPEVIVMPKPTPIAPTEPIPTEEVRRVIKKEEDIEKRIEELRKKKELERQREKERLEKVQKPEERPTIPPPMPPAPELPELDLMKDEIERRIAEMIKRKRSWEGQAGESVSQYISTKIITKKLLDTKEVAHLSKDIEDKCTPIGFVNLRNIYPHARYGTDIAIIFDCSKTDCNKLKRETSVRGECDIILALTTRTSQKRIYPELKELLVGEPVARYAYGKKKELILQVTGTESKYSGAGSQWIKTPVSVSLEKDQNAHYLLYRRGSGKETSTSYHTKTYNPIYIERYQGPFGYTVEIRFTDERNSVIKIIFDPTPNPKFINGVLLENNHKIAEFDVDEPSFRKAEQFAREKNIIKEGLGENIQTCVVCKKKFTAIDDEHLVDEGYICSARCYKKTEGWQQVRKTIKGD